MILTLLFLAVLGGYHVHFMLTAGDWDFWVDWKDRRMWPTVVPILGVTFAAATQAFFWENFRLPFGAIFAVLGLLIGEWINRYVNFWGWTYFPISLVFPSALIVPALWLDIILLLSGSYVITASSARWAGVCCSTRTTGRRSRRSIRRPSSMVS